MAIDASQVLDSPQLAAASVWPRGRSWRQHNRQYIPLAMIVAPLTTRIMMGPRPDPAPAQTPPFGGNGLLAVTKDALVLVSLKPGGSKGMGKLRPAEVVARVSLGEIRTFDLEHARVVWPLTITLHNGDIWRLEVPRFNKKDATAVAAIVNGQSPQA
jgi:hypothetical protein